MIRPGNPALMKAMNRAAVVDLLSKQGPISQTQICEVSGLARATVSKIITELRTEGLVVELHRAESKGGGRRQVLLGLNETSGYVVGVDLGGTKMAGALTDLGGRPLVRMVQPTAADRGGDAVLSSLVSFINEIVTRSGIDPGLIRGVGVGIPGVVLDNGVVKWAPALGWQWVDLKRDLEAALPYRVFVENDVNLLALGEYWYGAGQGSRSMACLAIGTGLGAGIVLDGRLHLGSRRAAGEVCDLVTDPSCLGLEYRPFGCLEQTASGTGLAALYRLKAQGRADAGADTEADAERVFELARKGDPAAVEAVEEFARHLSIAVLALATVLDPEVIVLGGGVAGGADLFKDRLEELCRPVLQAAPDIRVSSLGVDAGVMGAVALTLHSTTENPLATMVK
jgi:glucokinase